MILTDTYLLNFYYHYALINVFALCLLSLIAVVLLCPVVCKHLSFHLQVVKYCIGKILILAVSLLIEITGFSVQTLAHCLNRVLVHGGYQRSSSRPRERRPKTPRRQTGSSCASVPIPSAIIEMYIKSSSYSTNRRDARR